MREGDVPVEHENHLGRATNLKILDSYVCVSSEQSSERNTDDGILLNSQIAFSFT